MYILTHVKRRLVSLTGILSGIVFIFLITGCSTERSGADAANVHPAGWDNTDSPQFHGAYIQEFGYNLDYCTECHGSDFTGGSSGESCNTSECHGAQSPAGCTTCHGDVNPAPPPDTEGNSDNMFITVGAHQAHVTVSGNFPAMPCTECHLQYSSYNTPGHMTDSPDDVHFGTIASAQGASPQWDSNSATCSEVYCHGASMLNPAEPEPDWRDDFDGTNLCFQCHDYLTESPGHQIHWDDLNYPCSHCHLNYAQTHINKIVDVQFNPMIGGSYDYQEKSCSNVYCHGLQDDMEWDEAEDFTCHSCHGSSENPAPPYDLTGNDNEDSLSVGAHQNHLAETGICDPFSCSDCHLPVSSIGAHINFPPAEISFSGLATQNGGLPTVYNSSSGECSDVHCHGGWSFDKNASSNGWIYTAPDGMMRGNSVTMVWNQFGAGYPSCGTDCHSLPPVGHQFYPSCNNCHSGVVNSNNEIIDKSKHINGLINVFGL
ncbi:CxxxxCH/CxxCH domain-containing protein [bacterium]|nr:CxxxxCH/CxxCH domain-containing protein [FCB group bacterium]MBL7192069.1 CxxxxCH/CxxCH domain-containing protein [bacterium]